jgi:predicted RNA-binding protein with TRAM domain
MIKRHERARFIGEKKKGQSGSQKRGAKPLLEVGNEFDVKIEQLGHAGDGLVKIDGYTVFIKNVSVGEEVKIKITQVKETIARAIRLN